MIQPRCYRLMFHLVTQINSMTTGYVIIYHIFEVKNLNWFQLHICNILDKANIY